MEIIRTESLTKRYKDFTAVNNISIHVKPGEIYGFLGLNGAGKTTAIRMLLGMVKPSVGHFKLFGKDFNTGKTDWNDVGYLVETPHAYPNLSVLDNLKIFARLRGLEFSAIEQVIEKLQLGIYREKTAGKLSLGNQQRLGIAKALMHQPKLLILDEPINGLDPQGIVEVRELLKTLAQNGTTIFLSSHILSEISRLATRIGIIHEGKLIRELYAEELEKQLIHKLLIRTSQNMEALVILKEAGYNDGSIVQDTIEIYDPKSLQHPEKISALLAKNKYPPMQLYTFIEDLEHYFLRIIHSAKE